MQYCGCLICNWFCGLLLSCFCKTLERMKQLDHSRCPWNRHRSLENVSSVIAYDYYL
ncbi:hypothetical protein J437_LFUL008376 [Ladona fulva]|uniref:Uncharacterized protein n=1 Tax=Ladona fulva TaxID=123851 RepID=A0A8K0K6A0_LADFU|nr:hypothetical protein J437_LFUL008376 [Ladona fulva]